MYLKTGGGIGLVLLAFMAVTGFSQGRIAESITTLLVIALLTLVASWIIGGPKMPESEPDQ